MPGARCAAIPRSRSRPKDLPALVGTEGLCGAIYAAMAAPPDRAEELKAAFTARVGSLYCKEIAPPSSIPAPRAWPKRRNWSRARMTAGPLDGIK